MSATKMDTQIRTQSKREPYPKDSYRGKRPAQRVEAEKNIVMVSNKRIPTFYVFLVKQLFFVDKF